MLNMYLIAEQENINIRWWNFVQPVSGLYWAPCGKQPVIGLDYSLKDNYRLLRCVMAEELGHHFTTSSKCIKDVCFNYRDRLDVSRVEFKALRWAATYLIPFDQLDEALLLGMVESYQLAEMFDVTVEMVNFRLRLPDCKKSHAKPISSMTYKDFFT